MFCLSIAQPQPVDSFKCTICLGDIGQLDDVQKHWCFKEHTACVTYDGWAYIDDEDGAANAADTTASMTIQWPPDEVLTLINAWNRKSTLKNTKEMWQSIADEIATEHFAPSVKQIYNKWIDLRQMYKKCRATYGSRKKKKPWKYLFAMDDVMSVRLNLPPLPRPPSPVEAVESKTNHHLDWPPNIVRTLLDAHKRCLSVGDSVKYMCKYVAKQIANDSFKPTWEQVANKWKSLLRTHRKMNANTNTKASGVLSTLLLPFIRV